MPTVDPRVDAYIACSAAFAQPILAHLRNVVHGACPAVVETLKWGMPFFVYRGRNLVFMAAFKAHAGFGFWQGRAVDGVPDADEGMGQFGKLTALKDLPTRRALTAMIKTAARMVDADSKAAPADPGAPKRQAAQARRQST
jgi:hypothetical protein